MTLSELLDALDGDGLVITDEEAVARAVNDLGVKMSAEIPCCTVEGMEEDADGE